MQTILFQRKRNRTKIPALPGPKIRHTGTVRLKISQLYVMVYRLKDGSGGPTSRSYALYLIWRKHGLFEIFSYKTDPF